jgi:putative SOS response-associated peptidase YedK
MCGRFALYSKFDDVLTHFQIAQGNFFNYSYNIAPTQIHPTICLTPENTRMLVPMQWGLIPAWDKSAKPRKHFNARSESILEKPTFRNAFTQRRCLVIADGFFEWKTESTKQPYFFYMKSRLPFAFAAIWERRIEEDKIMDVFSLITTEANEVVAPVHDRMPVIIKPENYNLWMSSTTKDTQLLKKLLSPYSSDEMQTHAVTSKMNTPKFNTNDCIAPLANLP